MGVLVLARRGALDAPARDHPLTDATTATAPPADPAASIGERIGHRFADASLLRQALTHRSAVAAPSHGGRRRNAGTRRGAGSNERLEFIGDRVLGLLLAEWLLERFPDEQEGELGRRHAHLVSRDALAPIAERLGLAGALRLAPDASQNGVGALANVLADALEALLGAVHLDAGLDAARRVVRLHWRDAMDALVEPPKDAKTALQEWLLARGLGLPDYVEAGRDGPSHAPRFVVEARSGGLAGTGEASSKRVAERLAASELLARLVAASRSRRKARPAGNTGQERA